MHNTATTANAWRTYSHTMSTNQNINNGSITAHNPLMLLQELIKALPPLHLANSHSLQRKPHLKKNSQLTPNSTQLALLSFNAMRIKNRVLLLTSQVKHDASKINRFSCLF